MATDRPLTPHTSKCYRVGGVVGITGKGMVGNPGAVQDVWASSVEEAQAVYTRNNPSKRDPYSYAVLEHRDDDCPACDKLFCTYSWR